MHEDTEQCLKQLLTSGLPSPTSVVDDFSDKGPSDVYSYPRLHRELGHEALSVCARAMHTLVIVSPKSWLARL